MGGLNLKQVIENIGSGALRLGFVDPIEKWHRARCSE